MRVGLLLGWWSGVGLWYCGCFGWGVIRGGLEYGGEVV